jgi:hypothetical protein
VPGPPVVRYLPAYPSKIVYQLLKKFPAHTPILAWFFDTLNSCILRIFDFLIRRSEPFLCPEDIIAIEGNPKMLFLPTREDAKVAAIGPFVVIIIPGKTKPVVSNGYVPYLEKGEEHPYLPAFFGISVQIPDPGVEKELIGPYPPGFKILFPLYSDTQR